jgi:hypothetical protein
VNPIQLYLAIGATHAVWAAFRAWCMAFSEHGKPWPEDIPYSKRFTQQALSATPSLSVFVFIFLSVLGWPYFVVTRLGKVWRAND